MRAYDGPRSTGGMTLTTALAAVAALVAGTVGAVTTYQLAAPEPTTTATAAESSAPAKQADRRPRLAPCKKPAKLADGKCVTTITREVSVPGSTSGVAPGAGGQPPVAPQPPSDSGGFDDDARRDHGDDDLEVVHEVDDDDGFDDVTNSHGLESLDTAHDTDMATDMDTGMDTDTGTRTRTGGTGTSG